MCEQPQHLSIDELLFDKICLFSSHRSVRKLSVCLLWMLLQMNTDDDTCNPVVLSKLLRLDWVFIHISALVVAPAGTEGVDMTLTSDGIFTRCIELRYTLAEDSADAVAHGGMGVRGSGDANRRMREQFGSGRWGWDQGRHVAVEIDPFLANLKIRSVEVRG